MLNKTALYWLLQFLGWTGLFSLSLINKEVNLVSILKVLSISFLGIGLSHSLRFFILRWKIHELKFIKQSLFVIASSIADSLIFSTIQYSLFKLFFNSGNGFFNVLEVLNISVYFVIWQIIYFTFLLREKSRHEMLNNLELKALNNEIELKNLRSQLNPHFIFNALNSVRALIDEDKKRAKNAVNLLSNVMRSILLSEKQKMISVAEEMKLVSDYLAIEKIRFEERLEISTHIDDEVKNELLPPLIIQTLAENAIKHGVSNRVNKSAINIAIKNTSTHFTICVENDVSPKKTDNFKSTNTGLLNLKKRLEIIYKNNASFSLEISEKAKALIKIPKRYESHNN